MTSDHPLPRLSSNLYRRGSYQARLAALPALVALQRRGRYRERHAGTTPREHLLEY